MRVPVQTAGIVLVFCGLAMPGIGRLLPWERLLPPLPTGGVIGWPQILLLLGALVFVIGSRMPRGSEEEADDPT